MTASFARRAVWPAVRVALSAGAFFALADDEQVVAALPPEDGFGRAFDGIRGAEPEAG